MSMETIFGLDPDEGGPMFSAALPEQAGNLVRDPTFASADEAGEGAYWEFAEAGWAAVTSGTAVDALGVNRALQGPPGDGTTSWAGASVSINPATPLLVEGGVRYKVRIRTYVPTGFVGRVRVSFTGVPVAGSPVALGSFEGTDYRTVAAAAPDAEEINGKFDVPLGNVVVPPYRCVLFEVEHLPSSTLANPADKPLTWARPAVTRKVKAGAEGDLVREDGETEITDDDLLAAGDRESIDALPDTFGEIDTALLALADAVEDLNDNKADLVGGKVPESQIPAVAITDTFEVASQAAMLALTAEPGDVAVRSDENKSYILKASPASTLANWIWLRTPTDVVLSVAGKTGAVTLAAADVIMATARIVGRVAGGSGGAEELTAAQVKTLLAIATGDVSGLGALALLASVGTSQLDADAVTYAKLQNVSATMRVLGRISAGAGDAEELTAANLYTILGVSAFVQTLLDDATGAAFRATLRPRYGLIAAETAAVIDAAATELRRARSLIYDDLIAGLVDAGIWAKLDWVFAPGLATTEAIGLLDLKVPSRSFTKGSGAVFTASRGIVGSGSAEIATLALAANAGLFVRDNGSFGCVLRTTRAASSNKVAVGTATVTVIRLGARIAGDLFGSRNCDAGGGSPPASTTTIGFFADSRLVSTDHDVYFGGSAVSSPTKTNVVVASTAAAPASNWTLAPTVSGVNEDAEMSFAFAGQGLTQTEINTMFTLVKAALQATGSWV